MSERLNNSAFWASLEYFGGLPGPGLLWISLSLAMAEFSVKSFALLCGEGCMNLAHRSVHKQTVMFYYCYYQSAPSVYPRKANFPWS